MTYSTLIVETGENFVGTITLNRPDQLNTFTTPLAIDLQQALLTMDADPKVRAVLVRGAGKAFCAGIDVNELEGKTAMEYREWIERMELPHLGPRQAGDRPGARRGRGQRHGAGGRL